MHGRFLGFHCQLYLGMILEIFYPALMAYSVLKLLPCVTRFGYNDFSLGCPGIIFQLANSHAYLHLRYQGHLDVPFHK